MSFKNHFNALGLVLVGMFLFCFAGNLTADEKQKAFKLGIIGLDTSHSIAFTKILNDPKAKKDLQGFKVVVAYPHGSADIHSSASRIPRYTKEIQQYGVKIASSIDELLSQVDGVLLETNDGRPHLKQLRKVIKAKKPVFVDKPVSASLEDAVTMYREAREAKIPMFTSSSLRYMASAQAVRNGSIGKVTGCDAYSPCSLEKTHPDLFWYGIHGVETLFTVMGVGCKTVSRTQNSGTELVVGVWDDGKVGTFRGIRNGKGSYGGTAFGTKGIQAIGPYQGYRPLLVEIAKFFKTGKAPVSERESLEIYAFMEAADESKRRNGQKVSIEEVLKKAGWQGWVKKPSSKKKK